MSFEVQRGPGYAMMMEMLQSGSLSDAEKKELVSAYEACTRLATRKVNKQLDKLPDNANPEEVLKKAGKGLEKTMTQLFSSNCSNPGCQTPIAQETLKKCSRCRQAAYCGPDCQKAHWKEHKKVCKIPPN